MVNQRVGDTERRSTHQNCTYFLNVSSNENLPRNTHDFCTSGGQVFFWKFKTKELETFVVLFLNVEEQIFLF